jgi:hypothetical protein
MREKRFRFESMYNNWMALPFDEKRGVRDIGSENEPCSLDLYNRLNSSIVMASLMMFSSAPQFNHNGRRPQDQPGKISSSVQVRHSDWLVP